MGENIKTDEKQAWAYRLREQIRHTESDITETVHTLEQKLSPRYLRQRGARKAKRLAWEGTARVLDLAQRTSVQASLVGAGAFFILVRNRMAHKTMSKSTVAPAMHLAGTAAKAPDGSSLLMLRRKDDARKEAPAKKPTFPGIALAAAAAKSFLIGARAPKKRSATRPGKKGAWRGLAAAIGAALGSYWYSQKERRV